MFLNCRRQPTEAPRGDGRPGRRAGGRPGRRAAGRTGGRADGRPGRRAAGQAAYGGTPRGRLRDGPAAACHGRGAESR